MYYTAFSKGKNPEDQNLDKMNIKGYQYKDSKLKSW